MGVQIHTQFEGAAIACLLSQIKYRQLDILPPCTFDVNSRSVDNDNEQRTRKRRLERQEKQGD